MDLATYRNERGLSQEECAKALGLRSKSYISGIEKGRVGASLRLALKIEKWSAGKVKAASLNPEAAALSRTRAA